MSLTYKDRALRRLKTHRADGLEYSPLATPSTFGAFGNSPMLYYQVYDSNLVQVRKGVTYSHSLEELHYMAIDNADRLGTFDRLFHARPGFSSKTMTVRDLILTAFVGTSTGEVTSMLACPYQGEMPYDLDTSLFAIVASDLLPNTRSTPLRLALNVPAKGLKRWSHMSKMSIFGSSATPDTELVQMHKNINLGQIVDLRNDPSGYTHYSKEALAAMKPKPSTDANAVVAPTGVEPISDGAQAGTALSGGDEAPQESMTSETALVENTQPAEIGNESGTPVGDGLQEESTTVLSSEDTTRAPIALVTDEASPASRKNSSTGLDAISGPLQAARLEDKTTTVHDKMAVEASESHPAFDSLEHDLRATHENSLEEPVEQTHDAPDIIRDHAHTSSATGESAAPVASSATDDFEGPQPPLQRDPA